MTAALHSAAAAANVGAKNVLGAAISNCGVLFSAVAAADDGAKTYQYVLVMQKKSFNSSLTFRDFNII